MNPLPFRLIVGVGLILAGVVVAVLGWVGVSRELEVAFQLPYLASAGVGAILLTGAGSAMLVSAQLERDTQRLDELEDGVRLLAAEVGRLADVVDTVASPDSEQPALRVVEG